jgi:hypothetical protein
VGRGSGKEGRQADVASPSFCLKDYVPAVESVLRGCLAATLSTVALRWHGRLELEASMMTLGESQLAVAALASPCAGEREAVALLGHSLRHVQPTLAASSTTSSRSREVAPTTPATCKQRTTSATAASPPTFQVHTGGRLVRLKSETRTATTLQLREKKSARKGNRRFSISGREILTGRVSVLLRFLRTPRCPVQPRFSFFDAEIDGPID